MLKFYHKSRQFGCFNLISGLKDSLEKKVVTTFDYGRWVQSGLTVFHWQSLGKKNCGVCLILYKKLMLPLKV